LAWALVAVLAADNPPRFTDVHIDMPYGAYLRARPLLMEVEGATVIRPPNGNQVVLGVGATVLKNHSAKERLRAETVCRVKALASVVAEKDGVQVAHVEQLAERTAVVLEDGKEKARSVSELLQVTRTQARGIGRGMAVVGRWRSADGDTFYVAVGAICDRHGKPMPAEAPQ
jgi:hypothetical protein